MTVATALGLGTAQAAKPATVTYQEVMNEPLKAAEKLVGKPPRQAVASFLDVALPSPSISGIVLVLRPETTSSPDVCSTTEVTLDLKPVYENIRPFAVLNYSLRGSPRSETRYFRRSTDCADPPRYRYSLFTAPNALTAGRGIDLLDQAVAVAKGSPGTDQLRCIKGEWQPNHCDAQAILAKYVYAIESITPCGEACLKVDPPFGWGGPAIVLWLFGRDKLDYVAVEHVMRPVV